MNKQLLSHMPSCNIHQWLMHTASGGAALTMAHDLNTDPKSAYHHKPGRALRAAVGIATPSFADHLLEDVLWEEIAMEMIDWQMVPAHATVAQAFGTHY